MYKNRILFAIVTIIITTWLTMLCFINNVEQKIYHYIINHNIEIEFTICFFIIGMLVGSIHKKNKRIATLQQSINMIQDECVDSKQMLKQQLKREYLNDQRTQKIFESLSKSLSEFLLKYESNKQK